MSFLGDALNFEKFALKDLWGGIKDDPWRLLVGSVDPLSTGLWNTVLGRDDEPLVNQLGGPYGGSGMMGLGNDGGVYQRARDAGVDVGAANKMHDMAEVIASIYGGYGAMNGLGNAFGAMGGGGGGGGEGLLGGGGEGGMFDFGAMDWSNPSTYMDLMGQMPGGMPGQGGQQAQAPAPGPSFSPGGSVGPMSGLPQKPRTPRRLPMGLLGNSPEEQEMLNKMLGGLLS